MIIYLINLAICRFNQEHCYSKYFFLSVSATLMLNFSLSNYICVLQGINKYAIFNHFMDLLTHNDILSYWHVSSI